MAASTRKTTSKKKTPRPAKAAATPGKSKPRATAAKKLSAKKTATKAPPAKKKSAKAVALKARPAVPLPRRAIFIDVENTSNEESLSKVIDGLKIDRTIQPTELYAFGNWRAVGQTMSRHLARLGATLVHTSPVTGVKDWSDLWIAVAAGRWIALASPGDILEIVSNDKAFEAVGDAAANTGVVFHRVLHRAGSAGSAAAAADSGDETKPKRRRRRGGRGRRSGTAKPSAHAAAHGRPVHERPVHERSTPAPAPTRAERAPRPARAAAPKVEPAPKREVAATEVEAVHAVDGHTASHDQVLAIIRRLIGGDPDRWVNLDVIANALKAEGFVRPPGSPRLVVRLRRMKDVEVQPSGMVRLTS